MNTLTKKISQMELNDVQSMVSSQNSNSQPTFTRVSRTDSTNTSLFGSSLRSNGAAQTTVRTATLHTKTGSKSTNQSLRALAAAKGAVPLTTRSAQPLATTRTNQQVLQQPSRTPTLNAKGSQSSIRSVQYTSTAEKQQKEWSGTASTVAPSSILPSMEGKPSASKVAVQAAGGIDLGKYDGGFEAENDKRGSAVFGEAAEILALDSSASVQVFYCHRLCSWYIECLSSLASVRLKNGA